MIAYADLPRRVFAPTETGYVAGTADGIVTVNGQPASRPIYLYEVGNGISLMTLVARQASLANGHYIFIGLDPNKQYLIMARDSNKEYEPAVWDYVTPARDLTLQQQQELWQSWQTSQ